MSAWPARVGDPHVSRRLTCPVDATDLRRGQCGSDRAKSRGGGAACRFRSQLVGRCWRLPLLRKVKCSQPVHGQGAPEALKHPPNSGVCLHGKSASLPSKEAIEGWHTFQDPPCAAPAPSMHPTVYSSAVRPERAAAGLTAPASSPFAACTALCRLKDKLLLLFESQEVL